MNRNEQEIIRHNKKKAHLTTNKQSKRRFNCQPATIKFKNGEEIFAKVAASEEEGRTMLIVSHPIIVKELKGRSGIVGYKIEPWLKTTTDDMFIINRHATCSLSIQATISSLSKM